MPRKRRRQSQSSVGATVGGALSVMLFIGVAAAVVVLRAQRRAEWRDAQSGRTVDRSDHNDDSGFHTPAPNPFPHVNPLPPNPAPNPQPHAPAPPTPPEPKLPPNVRQTRAEGGAFAANPYSEYREDGALLVGFDIGLGKVFDTDIISYLRPIWLTADGEKYGTAYGQTEGPITTVRARGGYAIGGVVVAGGGALEGIAFTFMKRGAKKLDASDVYVSDWYGEQRRKPAPEAMQNGDGTFVIGIHGKRFDDRGGKNFDDGGSIATIGSYLWDKP